ncbi:GntR family transcriptional regulator [Sediminispirochaeta smaragdinae]|uniref:Transcriptional regulator, GntR family n=1 Tax=Sediminispirochaeta smaragdinae (strain DSM 11293 / JCM 15392 / SEBR 4228) TaxID=573413 RepID=E1RCP7_SEDSS|nr:GntR family transcriptional regulator [Sediminispirochaeta smaragdinae]ADK80127.1 transcriptional regulator, GntR family [Sediminispirochaeta smaragdinae DSM 11293]
MENRDLKTVAYEILRKKLINCEYAPGSILNEAQICNELGLSRTPIREALNRIANEGFVRILPKKGIFVTEISLNDVMQIFQARLEIEPVAVRMAGMALPEKELLSFREAFSGEDPDVQVGYRLDTAMHLFIIEYCGNRFIIDMMRKLFDENTRVIISSKQNQCKIHDARLEHLEIIDLLLSRDIEKAAQAMASHIESCKKAALDYFYTMQPFSVKPSGNYKKDFFS